MELDQDGVQWRILVLPVLKFQVLFNEHWFSQKWK
jgi:hypothetical protein